MTRHVLVADDDPIQRSLVAGALERAGYAVTAAADGKEALDALEQPHPPRVVVVDWNMPGISGPELCTWVREHDDRPPTYVILLTMRTGADDLSSGLAAGADDYLTKPGNPVELLARVGVGWRAIDDRDLLRDAIADLTDANEMLATFSRALAHDLRGSLATAGAHLFMIGSDAHATSHIRSCVDKVAGAHERMGTMVDDVLSLESMSRHLPREEIDVASLVRGAAADARGIDLQLGAALPATVLANRAALTRAFKNLLENAANHARHEDGRPVQVQVSGSTTDHAWTFDVTDDGPGVPPDDRERIFLAFERGRRHADRGGPAGTGLGLSIVAACARAHDGTVEVVDAPGGGATFRFTIRRDR